MFDNPKRAFLEAFILAVIIFVFGIILGVSFENNRLDKINEYYALSEISLMDSIALGQMADLNVFSCSDLIENNINFADKIYTEAALLEKYEESGDLTDSLALAHKKYDVLRTVLWINVMKTRDRCKSNLSSVVYLYDYNTKDFIKDITPYAIFTIVGVGLLFFVSYIIPSFDNRPYYKWWEDMRFLALFIPISVLQEIIFRGILMKFLRHAFSSPMFIIILNASLFSLIHVIYDNSIFILPMTFIGGIGFAWIYYKYPNLILVSISHTVLNFTAMTLGFFVIR